MSNKRFYYWRELLFMLFMLTVLALNVTYFEALFPFGDEGSGTSSAGLIAR